MYYENNVAKKTHDNTLKITIHGAGVAHVDASSVLKSSQGKRQLEALKKIKERESSRKATA